MELKVEVETKVATEIAAKIETRKREKLLRLTLEAPNRVTCEYKKGRLTITALSSKILRLHYSPTETFAPRRSWAVAKDDSEFAGATLIVTESPTAVELATDDLALLIRSDGGVKLLTKDGQILFQDAPEQGPVWNADGSLKSCKVLPANEYYYGFGERTSLLEKRGKRYTCWNTDPGDINFDHGPGADRLHQSIPFFMALRPETGGYGLFLNNTFKTVFDVGHSNPDCLSIEATGGELDYYVFYGPEPAAIVEAYTALTGRTPLPPRWALGYHQSRWGYYPESRVREIVENFRSRQIPLDAVHLDIDYMQGYRVFTWDKTHFPEPEKLIKDVGEQGVKLVTIVDPGVKYDPNNDYGVYEEGAEQDYFIRDAQGEVFHGYVWPDDSVFPDFAKPEVREWWGDLHKHLINMGVQGIWNDMNEPALANAPFNTPCKLIEIPSDAPQGNGEEVTSHAEVHNIYALLENMATFEGLRKLKPDTRPFLLTRAGYAGIQRWSAVWTGDNAAIWEHLEMAMPELCNLGLSGVSFTGTDIGGFHWNSNSELWARWIQLGAFYPFSRGHSITTAHHKEPWVWGERTEKIARNYIELRYRFLPYLYSLFEESSRTGAPVMRPLLYEFHHDPKVMSLYDEVMVGSGLLLAPVYRPGVEYRHVYLPGENWYDFWSGEAVLESNVLAHAPLEVMPMYVRGGTILPLGPIMQYTDERPLDQLTLEIYLDNQGSATGRLYEDDGISYAYTEGQNATTTYTATTDANGQTCRISARRTGAYQLVQRPVELHLHTSQGLNILKLGEDKGNWDITLPLR